MLTLFREKIMGWAAKILFALLILSFGIWGIGDYIGRGGLGGTSNVAATVGGQEISIVALQREVTEQTNRLRSILGENATPEKLRQLGIASSALERLIQQRVLVEGADDLGLVADDATIRDYIASDPRFAGVGGIFDRKQYVRTLRSQGQTEESFESLVRGQLIQRQFLSGVELGGKAPNSLVSDVFSYRNERRTAEVLRLDHASITDVPAPTEAELVKFHKENSRRFTAPEFRKLTVVLLRAKDLMPEIAVSEQRLKEEYENRLGEFTVPEKRHVRQFVLNDEKAAYAAVERIRKGEDFLAVAKELAGIDEKTADLGDVTVRQIPLREIGRAAFSTPGPKVLDPVHTGLGWHVIQVVSIQPEKRTSFEDARARLLTDVRREIAIDDLTDLGNKFEDALGGGATLEAAAARLNIKPLVIDAVDSLGRTPDGRAIIELPDNSKPLFDAAFAASEGEVSPLTEIGDDVMFTVRVDKIIPPAVRPLDTIRATVADAWKAEKQAEIAQNKAKEMLEKVKGGIDLEKVAKEYGATLYTSKPFLRTSEGLEKVLPAPLIVDLFKAKRGEAVTASGAAADFVARLKDISGPEAGAKEAEAMSALRKELDQGISNDLAEELYLSLRRKFGVTIDQSVVDRAY